MRLEGRADPVTAGANTDQSPSAIDAPGVFDVAEFVGLRRVLGLVPAPGQTWAVAPVERLDHERARGVVDLWRVPLGGDAASRLTVGDTRETSPAFGPDGSLYFLSDRAAPPGAPARDDEKRAQVWVLPAAGGEARPITDEPLGVADFRVAGRTLALITEVVRGVAHEAQRAWSSDRKKKGPTLQRYSSLPVRFWDRWLGPASPHLIAYDLVGTTLLARRDLTPDADEALRETAWELAPDGLRVAICWQTMNPADRIFDRALTMIDTQTGARVEVTSSPGTVAGAPRFSPDGRRLAFTHYLRTADAYAHRSLWLATLDADGGCTDVRPLTPSWDRWPGPIDFTSDGRAILALVEDRGRHRAFLVDVASGDALPVGPSEGSWDALRLHDGRLVGVRSSLLRPPEAFVCAMTEGAEPIPLAALSGFDPARADQLASAEELTVEVEPGRTVQAWHIQSRVLAARPQRTLLWIHGGPVHAWTDQWHWRWSPLLMAARGYDAVLPNPAGSTGFGSDWVNGIWGNTWGERCYADLIGLVDALETRGTLRAADTAVMGGSFGGYMTNWIGGHTDRFRLLVSHASIFQLSSFSLTTDVPAWWWLMMRSRSWSDPAFDRHAPARFVANWKTPVLILHGERDFRVPITESLALFEALQLAGVPSELAIFPDENHWIGRPNNVRAWYDAVLEFLERRWDPPDKRP